jgi:hypothetical protein
MPLTPTPTPTFALTPTPTPGCFSYGGILTAQGDVLEDDLSNQILFVDSCVSLFLDGVESQEVLGSISIEQDYVHSDLSLTWKSGSYVSVDLNVFWSIGAGILKWYRVQGKCAPCAVNNNCQATGLQVLGERCIGGATGQQFYIQNILATNVKEVCSILQESKLNWEVCTIKVYSRPADPSLSGPEDTCNTLYDVPFESIPECINVYTQEKPFIKMKMTAIAITTILDVNNETFSCGLSAESNELIKTDLFEESLLIDGPCITVISVGGSAIVTGDTGNTSIFDYTSLGYPSLTIGGSDTGYSSSWQNELSVDIKMTAKVSYLEAILNSQDKNSLLVGATGNIRTLCGNCTTMPSIFYLGHNFSSTPEISNFLNRNTATLPSVLLMRYSRKSKAWQSSYQMNGQGSYGIEKWNFSFTWSCMDSLGEEKSSPYWKFSMFINRIFLSQNLDFDTKINIVFPPDYLCNQINNLSFDLIFSLNTVTQYVSNDFVGITEEVVLADNIGLFKSNLWKSNPLLNINLSNSPIKSLLESTSLTPIIPVVA